MSAEQLNDLKGVWKRLDTGTEFLTPSDCRDLSDRWRKRNKGTLLRFALELTVSTLIYISSIMILVLTSPELPGKIFGIKVILLSITLFTPIVISMNQSLNTLKQIDLTSSVSNYIRGSIKKLKNSQRLYIRHTYLFALFLTVILATDEYFVSQSTQIKAGTFIFIALVTLLTRPYLNYSYGGDITYFEKMYKSLNESESYSEDPRNYRPDD